MFFGVVEAGFAVDSDGGHEIGIISGSFRSDRSLLLPILHFFKTSQLIHCKAIVKCNSAISRRRESKTFGNNRSYWYRISEWVK